MKIAKLLFKIFFYFLPLWLIMLYIALFPQYYGYSIIAYNLWHKEKCKDDDLKNYNNIVIGDSVSNAAYIPDYISEDFINLSIPQSTPIEDYFVLKEILKIHKPSTIFMSFMDHHIAGNMNGLFKERMFSHRFDFFTESKIVYYAIKNREKSGFPQNYIHDWLSYRLYLPAVFMPSLLNARFKARKNENEDFIGLVELHRGSFISRSQIENLDNRFVNFNSYKIGKVQRKFYNKILQLCQDNGIKVKIVILPLNPKIQFSAEYVQQKKDFYTSLEEHYPNVEIVWPFVNLTSTDFIDTHHMNVHGAFKFSSALRQHFKDVLSLSSDEDLSMKTILGQEDYIRLETEFSTLLERIKPPFSAVIFNQTGTLADEFKNNIMMNNGVSSVIENVFYLNTNEIKDISSKKENAFSFVDFSYDNKKISLGKESIADLHILIMNNSSKTIVTEKRFVIKDGGLKLIN